MKPIQSNPTPDPQHLEHLVLELQAQVLVLRAELFVLRLIQSSLCQTLKVESLQDHQYDERFRKARNEHVESLLAKLSDDAPAHATRLAEYTRALLKR